SQPAKGTSKVLGDTTDGLNGSESGHSLDECELPNPTPGITAWQHLYSAWAEDQKGSPIGTHIVQFIVKAMNAASYPAEPVLFRTRHDRLNSVLALSGCQLTERGKVLATISARTISEVLYSANRLHSALVQRAVHADVLTFCRTEIV